MLFVCLGFLARANDLTLKVLSTQLITSDLLEVELEVEWGHSWNESINAINHDASWLFFKSKGVGESSWSTFVIDSIGSDDFDFKLSEDRLGVMLLSNVNASKESSFGTVKVIFEGVWQSLGFYAGGIEMVYINEGAYLLGDATSMNSIEDNSSNPVSIASEEALEFGEEISSSESESIYGDIPADYPKGFEAFYCMKYEVSQNQFCDFLNHIDYNQQKNILPVDPSSSVGSTVLFNGFSSNFNGITISRSAIASSGQEAFFICDLNGNGVSGDETDGETLACNFISWEQLLYYLDWTGLRPMTELEFEKSCRGPEQVVEREFSFGTAKVVDANTTLFDSTAYETYDIDLADGFGVASHGYLGRSGPLRNGFAGSENSDRLTSGASYYGVMELSGNLWEQTMGISKPNGLSFTGQHGDGDLSSFPVDWKLSSSMVRGGAWSSGVVAEYRDLAVSDRFYYDLEAEIARNTTGGRGVRSDKTLVP